MQLCIFKINYGLLRVKCLDLKCFNQRSFDIYSSATHAFIKVDGFLNLRKFSCVPSQSCSTAPLNHSTPVLISITMKALLECDISESQMDYLGTFDKNELAIDMRVYSWMLNSVPLIQMSILCQYHTVLITLFPGMFLTGEMHVLKMQNYVPLLCY